MHTGILENPKNVQAGTQKGLVAAATQTQTKKSNNQVHPFDEVENIPKRVLCAFFLCTVRTFIAP